MEEIYNFLAAMQSPIYRESKAGSHSREEASREEGNNTRGAQASSAATLVSQLLVASSNALYD